MSSDLTGRPVRRIAPSIKPFRRLTASPVGMTSYSFYVLTLVAEPVEPVSIFEVTARNSIGAGVGQIAAVVGASLGYRLSNTQRHSSPEAL